MDAQSPKPVPSSMDTFAVVFKTFSSVGEEPAVDRIWGVVDRRHRVNRRCCYLKTLESRLGWMGIETPSSCCSCLCCHSHFDVDL